MKPVTETELTDYLAGELPRERQQQIRQQLMADPELQRELEALEALKSELAALSDPDPSAEADARFAALLAAGPLRPAISRTWHPRAAALLAVAACLLFLTFGLGWYFGRTENSALEQQLAATRTLMLELMQDESSTTRMRAATVSLDVPVADPTVIRQLGHLLRHDPNTNVRLAALDALGRFADDPAARQEMLAAMAEHPPAAVQAQLMETLVALREERVLPYLQELLQNDSLPRPLRDAAELATFKLI